MSAAVLLAGLAGACALLAAWEAIAAAEQERVVQAARRWCAPVLDVLRSGREPTSPERRRLLALGTLALLGAGWLVAGAWAGLALAATAPWAARTAVRLQRRRRAAALAAAAPAIARALADALGGGHSVRGALSAVACDGAIAGPAGEEMRRVRAALALGERTEDVLEALARRAGEGALDALVAAVLLQREAGGDLAALLRDLAAALEQRGRVLADARSVTAQARFTAVLVCGLPAAGLALGELAQPGLLVGLASNPVTAAMLVAALMLQAIAFAWVSRIARMAGSP
ncbi:MAG: type II secretion system F family protein [Solirubrobacteraceae bacterium]|nr:type II secretion system F family protein [Solirubrobacteraceae bacterium]